MRKLVLFLIFIVAASQIWLWLLKDPVGPASRKVLYNEGRSIIMQRTNDGKYFKKLTNLRGAKITGPRIELFYKMTLV
jgi:hypothetical protein